MSILKVDTINEKTSGNGVQIAGHVVQVKQVTGSSFSTNNSASAYTDLMTLNITPSSNSNKIM